MQCPKCGWQNPDSAAKCNNCFTALTSVEPQQPQATQQQPYAPPAQQPYPQQPYAPGAAQSVPDYLIWSILVTLFCCLIPGVVAIVKSASANSKRSVGDVYGAMQDANAAKTWLWWSFGLGLAGNLLWVVIWLVAAIGSASHGLN